jgi:hypothetical protein
MREVDIFISIRNRLEFTKICFDALLCNVDWGLIQKIIIVQDVDERIGIKKYSPDDKKILEYLREVIVKIREKGVEVKYVISYFGSVPRVMRCGIRFSYSKYLFKIDNDVVIGTDTISRLKRVIDLSPELVVLGYGKIWNSKNIGVVLKENGCGYVECKEGKSKWIRSPKFHVGGLFIARNKILKKNLKNLRTGRKPFVGWANTQVNHFKKEGNKIGWYWPNIENTVILDFLSDPEVFQKAGLDYNNMCKLVDEYFQKGWTKRSLEYSKGCTQKSGGIWE